MTTVVVRSPDGTEEEHPLEAQLTLGRGDDNDLRLTEGGVSRKHARLYVGDDGGTYVEDLGSANGTYVDGEAIQGPTAIGAGAEIVVGEYHLVLQDVGPPRPSAARASSPPRSSGASAPRVSGASIPPRSSGAGRNSSPRASGSNGASIPPRSSGSSALARRAPEADPNGPRLRGLTGPWAGKRFPISGKISVGRVPGNEIVIDDGSVSRKHAELEVTPEGVVLRDGGSANGTHLNGAPVDQEFVLQPGDVVGFGVVEFSFEGPEGEEDAEESAALARAPVRRGGAAMTRGESRRRDQVAQAAEGRRTVLYFVGGVLFLVILAAALAKAYGVGGEQAGGDGFKPMPVRPGEQHQSPTAADVEQQVQGLLTECRSYAATDVATEPNWQHAEESCGKALQLQPINSEALALIQKIQKEKANQDLYDRGQRNLQRLKTEEALDFFSKLPEDSVYYRKAKPMLITPINDVKKKAAADCRSYVREGHPNEALPRCEVYVKYACQDMTTDELRPPIGYKLRLTDGKLKKNEWRPKDAMYLTFLRTRARVNPDAPAYQCPVIRVAQKGQTAEPPEVQVRKALEQRFPEKIISHAMFDYWRGASGEAIVQLQKMRDDMRYASLHKQATDLSIQIATIDQLYKTGEGALQKVDPEMASEPFEEALNDDTALMKEQALERPSFYRRNILQDMASVAFTKGNDLMAHHDAVRACRVYKLGQKFYRGNLDLQKAVNTCSSQAGDLMAEAKSCEDVKKALDLASEGDGVAERGAQVKKDLRCP